MTRLLLISHCLIAFLTVGVSSLPTTADDDKQAATLAYDLVDEPTSIAIVDLNRDKAPELVVTNRNANTVSVLLNNGTGIFALKSRYATGPAPSGVAAADLNSDGKPDVVVANSGSDNISVFLGNGDGTFTRGKNFPVGAVPSAIISGLLDRDTTPDLVIVNRYGSSISVLLGRGDGSFVARADYATSKLPYSVAISDVNRDGKADVLVTSCFDHTVWMIAGNGDGTMRPKEHYATAKRSCGTVIGNVGIDGAPAVIEPHRHGYLVSIQLVKPDKEATMRLELLSGKGPRSVLAADFNGDGVSDLAVANGGHKPGEPGSVFVFLGTGGGAFEAKSNYITGNASHSIARGDLNKDGKTDIAVLNGSLDFGGSVSVMLGNGDGTFGNRVDYATGGYHVWVSFGDDANSASEHKGVWVEKPPRK